MDYWGLNSMFVDLIGGFGTLFGDPVTVFFVVLAALIGIVFGALPGLTASAAIAMLLPLSFHMGALQALAFLYVIGKSGRYGGSIAAILFNTPGTAASAATMQDGFPMTQAGRSGKALRTATVASIFGDYFGEFILIFGAVYIAASQNLWTDPIFFNLCDGLCRYWVCCRNSILKGLLSTVFGGLVGLIGEDVITGEQRMTLGIPELESGMALVPLLIGVFVISEVIVQAEKAAKVTLNQTNPALLDQPDSNHFTWNEFKRCFPIMCRSSIIGSVIGMMPGLGSSVACFVAYGEEKRRSKTPEKWGTGIVEGVAAPESANNAVSGPSMIPLLSLGIPGSTIAAVLIGVFIIHGLQVGPQIFDDQNQIIVGVQVMTSREFIFALFAAGLVGIAAYGIIGYWAAPLIGRTIALIPQNYLYPFIVATAIAASFSSRSSIADVGFAILFGVIGYGMRRTNFSAAAFIIAFVLAGNMEEAFRQAMMISDNGLLNFVTEPISASFLAIGLGMLTFRISKQLRKIKVPKN